MKEDTIEEAMLEDDEEEKKLRIKGNRQIKPKNSIKDRNNQQMKIAQECYNQCNVLKRLDNGDEDDDQELHGIHQVGEKSISDI